jgi:hypothetical protein
VIQKLISIRYSQIGHALGRFEILSDAFKSDHGFQQTLAVFYTDILRFHKHAYIFVRRSGTLTSSLLLVY